MRARILRWSPGVAGVFVACALGLAGCSTARAPGDSKSSGSLTRYVRVLPVSAAAGFSSKLYKLPGENRNVALQDSTLLDLSGISGADVRAEAEPDRFTVRLFFTQAGKAVSARMLPGFQEGRVGIVVDGRLVGAPLAIEVAGQDSVTLIEHLAQPDAWALAAGINDAVEARAGGKK